MYGGEVERSRTGVPSWCKTVLEGAVEHSKERWLESELRVELVMWKQETMDGSLSPRIPVPGLGSVNPGKREMQLTEPAQLASTAMTGQSHKMATLAHKAHAQASASLRRLTSWNTQALFIAKSPTSHQTLSEIRNLCNPNFQPPLLEPLTGFWRQKVINLNLGSGTH